MIETPRYLTTGRRRHWRSQRQQVAVSPMAAPHVYYSRPRETVASLAPGTARRVTEKQLSRLFAIARGGRWTRDEVIDWVSARFGKWEPAELQGSEYDQLCDHILATPRWNQRRA